MSRGVVVDLHRAQGDLGTTSEPSTLLTEAGSRRRLNNLTKKEGEKTTENVEPRGKEVTLEGHVFSSRSDLFKLTPAEEEQKHWLFLAEVQHFFLEKAPDWTRGLERTCCYDFLHTSATHAELNVLFSGDSFPHAQAGGKSTMDK